MIVHDCVNLSTIVSGHSWSWHFIETGTVSSTIFGSVVSFSPPPQLTIKDQVLIINYYSSQQWARFITHERCHFHHHHCRRLNDRVPNLRQTCVYRNGCPLVYFCHLVLDRQLNTRLLLFVHFSVILVSPTGPCHPCSHRNTDISDFSHILAMEPVAKRACVITGDAIAKVLCADTILDS